MISQAKYIETDASVDDFISSLGSEAVKQQSLQLVALMKEITDYPPKMWGSSIIGFDRYHYIYESGREGDASVLGFSPRKNNFVIYLEETSKYQPLLKKIGKHKTSKVCLYFKSLSDIDVNILKEILKESYTNTKSLEGQITRAR